MSTSSDTPRHSTGSHYQPSLPVVFLLLLVFVAATFFIERGMPNTNTSSAAPASTTPTTTPTSSGTTSSTTTTLKQRVVPRSQVSVQVANGTSISGLARQYTQKLQTLGWNTLSGINGPSTQLTEIYYLPGYQGAALTIAASLHVPTTSAMPLGAHRPVPGATGDDVVVILGLNVAH
jgi:hypothetical protein